MSAQSDSGSENALSVNNGKISDDDVCRDFLRNVCHRGKRCKFRHPSSDAALGGQLHDASPAENSKSDQPTFCHDFQNASCNRLSCKFMHCTREEEAHFRETGQLPLRVQQLVSSNVGPGAPCGSANTGSTDIPVCRDFLKGACNRRSKCKFLHVLTDMPHDTTNGVVTGGANVDVCCKSSDHLRHDLKADLRQPVSNLGNSQQNAFHNFEEYFENVDRFEYSHVMPVQSHTSVSATSFHDGPQIKRKRLEMDVFGSTVAYDARYLANGQSTLPAISPISYQYQVLEEENSALRRRVDELKKHVSDLMATNEVLLEQNARLRVAKSTGTVAQATVVQVPGNIAAITPTPAMNLNVAGMVAQPVHVSGTALSTYLNSSLTQQIAINSDMATQYALHTAAQQMARELQQQHQQIAAAVASVPRAQAPLLAVGLPPLGAPLTVNPVVTMNPSLSSLPMPHGNLVAASIPCLVSHQQVAGVCSLTQNMCLPNNPLVSYPIMSQDVRCAVPLSSLGH